jgi:hypothetical protein
MYLVFSAVAVTLEFSAEGPAVVSGLQGLMVTVNWDDCMLKPKVAINGELCHTLELFP